MEDLSLFSRRDFLRGVGAFSAASLGFWAGGCESCVQQIQNRPTRKNIQTLWAANPSDPVITTYKAAVAAMKALDTSKPSDPRGWQYQANIHFNKCIHRNWLWLPWHRVYLFYFERICRKLTGDNSFALPYWNWNTHPAVPDPFWDTTSPLYDSNRAITQTDQADASYIGTSVLQNILNEPNFELFASGPPPTSDLHAGPDATGMLEGTPHNNIHGFVGGDMGAFHSPLDPVFYTHHNMLDCMWTHWNIDLNNANTNDTSWTNFAITDFVDENGNPVSVTAAITVLYPIFSYQFEPCSLMTAGQGAKKLQGKELEAFLRAGAPSKLEFGPRFELRQSVTTEVDKPSTSAITVEPGALAGALQGGSHTRLVLTVGDVEMPPKRDFFVRIFLNKPDVSGATPIEDPHYAGSFGFFFDESGMKSQEGAAGMSAAPLTGFLVDATPTLQKLNQAGSLSSNEVQVSLVPVPYARRQATGERLTLRRLELAVARF
ncbi:MAG TPA: tyrosinase family protein [Terriglobia bacterium]|nr:tyrosinase family protein [Terriglobia bacterium]